MKRILAILVMVFVLMIPQRVYAMDLEDITEPGTYEITISYTDPTGQVHLEVITLTITADDLDDGGDIEDPEDPKDPKPKPDPNTDDDKKPSIKDELETDGGKITNIVKLTEKIEAKNFSTKPGIVNTMTDEDLIRAASAHAYNIETKKEVEIVKVAVDFIQESQYRVTFTTKKGTQTSVKAFETQNQESVTWTEKETTTSSEKADEFSSFNGFTLAQNIVMLLVIPVGLIAVLFIYANKRIADAQKTLYKKEQEVKEKQDKEKE